MILPSPKIAPSVKKKEPSKNEGEKDPKKPPRPKVLPLPRNEWLIPKGYSAKNNKVLTQIPVLSIPVPLIVSYDKPEARQPMSNQCETQHE
jgi:hypothetical protein